MSGMTPRTIIASTAVGLLAIALSACGGSDGAASNTVPADIGLQVDAVPGLRFDSDTYTASPGAVKVALVNKDAQLHSLVLVDSDRRTLPGELKVGKSGDIDVKEYDLVAGTYQLLCLVPGHEDMKSTLEVE